VRWRRPPVAASGTGAALRSDVKRSGHRGRKIVLFAISRGSDGSGTERYVVYVPFTLAPGASLGALEGPAVSTGSGYQLRVEKLQTLNAISLGPFSSVAEARSYIAKARACLLWVSLKFNCGVSYPKDLSEVVLLDESIPMPASGAIAKMASGWGWSATDGRYDAHQVVIRPDNKRLVRWEMGRASVTIGISIDNFLSSTG